MTFGRTKSIPVLLYPLQVATSATSERSKQLLEPMRDAIKAHRSLYVTGNIFHRDISSNNIIITDPEVADGCKGMLIDLDLAKRRQRSKPSEAPDRHGAIHGGRGAT